MPVIYPDCDVIALAVLTFALFALSVSSIAHDIE